MTAQKVRAYLGADPGIGGAVALYVPSIPLGSVPFLEVRDTPTVKVGPKNRIDLWSLAEQLKRWATDWEVIATVENVHAMPGQGVTSMFSFGYSTGSLQQALASAKIPFTLVQPATWKAMYGLRGGAENKAASVAKAVDLFPKHRELFFGPKGGGKDGRAEAALLAHYGSKLQ
jgi:crossover junction endodeoxyribonuclease RuvC